MNILSAVTFKLKMIKKKDHMDLLHNNTNKKEKGNIVNEIPYNVQNISTLEFPKMRDYKGEHADQFEVYLYEEFLC